MRSVTTLVIFSSYLDRSKRVTSTYTEKVDRGSDRAKPEPPLETTVQPRSSNKNEEIEHPAPEASSTCLHDEKSINENIEEKSAGPERSRIDEKGGCFDTEKKKSVDATKDSDWNKS